MALIGLFFLVDSVKSNASAEPENLDKLLKTIDYRQNIDSRNTTVKCVFQCFLRTQFIFLFF